MRSVLVALFIIVLVVTQSFLLNKATAEFNNLPQADEPTIAVSPSLLKISSVGFEGVMADFIFLKALVYLGSFFERPISEPVKISEWKRLYNLLRSSADLDPYFLDPYYVANGTLTWGAGMVKETNSLLEQGMRYRTWDPLLPFLTGFNYYYFLKNDSKAIELLKQASGRPKASPLYADLAVKLSYKEKRIENTIRFQEFLIQNEKDGYFRKHFEIRLGILKDIQLLEKAVQMYRQRFKTPPNNLNDLVARHILMRLPQDSMGGGYYLDPSGDIRADNEESFLTVFQRK